MPWPLLLCPFQHHRAKCRRRLPTSSVTRRVCDIAPLRSKSHRCRLPWPAPRPARIAPLPLALLYLALRQTGRENTFARVSPPSPDTCPARFAFAQSPLPHPLARPAPSREIWSLTPSKSPSHALLPARLLPL